MTHRLSQGPQGGAQREAHRSRQHHTRGSMITNKADIRVDFAPCPECGSLWRPQKKTTRTVVDVSEDGKPARLIATYAAHRCLACKRSFTPASVYKTLRGKFSVLTYATAMCMIFYERLSRKDTIKAMKKRYGVDLKRSTLDSWITRERERKRKALLAAAAELERIRDEKRKDSACRYNTTIREIDGGAGGQNNDGLGNSISGDTGTGDSDSSLQMAGYKGHGEDSRGGV